MTIAYFILALLDWVSEFITLTYQAGAVTRRYILPAVVYLYVAGEYAWRYVTPTLDYYVHHTPFDLEARYVS